MSILDTVTAALSDAPPAVYDQAAAELAKAYATAIDDSDANPKTLADLGPKLLAALESLHLTPRSRALARLRPLEKGADGAADTGPQPASLAAARARRARKSHPATVDPTAP